MGETKKVLITLSSDVLSEVDSFVKLTKITRSALVQKALNEYLKGQKDKKNVSQMIKGYTEMARINSELAESALLSDSQAFDLYEEKISESE